MKTYHEMKDLYESGESFYESLGGNIAEEAKAHPESFLNTCAARLSQALNESGIRVPYIYGQTIKGDNNRNYFIRACDMKRYFERIWGESRSLCRPTIIKNGIVFLVNRKRV